MVNSVSKFAFDGGFSSVMAGLPMDGLWLFLAFSIGGCAGFLLFAMFHVSRDSASKRGDGANPVLLSLEFEGDTQTRF